MSDFISSFMIENVKMSFKVILRAVHIAAKATNWQLT